MKIHLQRGMFKDEGMFHGSNGVGNLIAYTSYFVFEYLL